MTTLNIVIGIVVKANKFLLIKRKKAENQLKWAFPGGKIEPDETAETAVIREILEETGTKCKITDCLGKRKHPLTDMVITYFCCEFEEQTETFSEREVEELRWCDYEEVLSLFTTDIYPPVLRFMQEKSR